MAPRNATMSAHLELCVLGGNTHELEQLRGGLQQRVVRRSAAIDAVALSVDDLDDGRE